MAESTFDFQHELLEFLRLPGVTRTRISEWSNVDPSTVTRWCQGVNIPGDPAGVLALLRRHIDRLRDELNEAGTVSEVSSWSTITRGLNPGLLQDVLRTGLMADLYAVVMCWVPSHAPVTVDVDENGATTFRDVPDDKREYDVVVTRFFGGVWADSSRSIYNIGDIAQTVSFDPANTESSAESNWFDDYDVFGDNLSIRLKAEPEIGYAVARLHAKLEIKSSPPARTPKIRHVGNFGYRYLARRAIASSPFGVEQTNDFLGAPIVIPAKKLSLIVCIPRFVYRGHPAGLAVSNRSMLKLLMGLDNASIDEVEALLWPRGRKFEIGRDQDAVLTELPRGGELVDTFVHEFRTAFDRAVDDKLDSPSVRDVLRREDSACFALNVHEPDPSLTYTIVWKMRSRV